MVIILIVLSVNVLYKCICYFKSCNVLLLYFAICLNTESTIKLVNA